MGNIKVVCFCNLSVCYFIILFHFPVFHFSFDSLLCIVLCLSSSLSLCLSLSPYNMRVLFDIPFFLFLLSSYYVFFLFCCCCFCFFHSTIIFMIVCMCVRLPAVADNKYGIYVIRFIQTSNLNFSLSLRFIIFHFFFLSFLFYFYQASAKQQREPKKRKRRRKGKYDEMDSTIYCSYRK